jgi:hypothetical protein
MSVAILILFGTHTPTDEQAAQLEAGRKPVRRLRDAFSGPQACARGLGSDCPAESLKCSVDLEWAVQGFAGARYPVGTVGNSVRRFRSISSCTSLAVREGPRPHLSSCPRAGLLLELLPNHLCHHLLHHAEDALVFE